MKYAAVVLMIGLAGCSGSNSISGPSEQPDDTNVQQQATSLPVPTRLRAVWAPASLAPGVVTRFGANTVMLQIETWDEDLAPYARWARERGIGAIPFVEQVFATPRESWPAYWSKVEKWAKPLRDVGILWGYHVTDEWVYRDLPQTVRDAAIAFVRERGYETLNTDDVNSVLHRDFQRPQGRWFGVNCYSKGSRTPWHTQGCVETYERHPEWTLVVVPAFAGGNIGQIYDQAAWEALADRKGASIAFWSWEQ